ncbi:MAG: hypothetical protein Q9225_004925 [Loekoesia sp. 1 TL-2023]
MSIRPVICAQGWTTRLWRAYRLPKILVYSLRNFNGNWGSQRAASSQTGTRTAEATTLGARYGSDLSASVNKRKRDDKISKELFLDVLGSTATKREAKSYLSRFRSEKPKTYQLTPQDARNPDVGVNLGNLYVPVRAIDQSPVFVQGQSKAQPVNDIPGSLHIALVKIRAPQSISDLTLRGVALTLVQLNRLGMSSVVVADYGNEDQNSDPDLRRLATEQANRVAAAIEYHDPHGTRRLDHVFEISGIAEGHHSSVKVQSGTHIASRNLLLTPLRKGKIPVVAPVAFASTSQALIHIPADEAILALTRDFAGLRSRVLPDAEPQAVAKDIKTMQKEISLDRVILLDPLGGIPSVENGHRSHVFINLEQEYEEIKSELSRSVPNDLDLPESGNQSPQKDTASRSFTSSNPISKFWDTQSSFGNEEGPAESAHSVAGHCIPPNRMVHLKNLGLLCDTLAILPPSSSGLLTTPEVAANSNHGSQHADPAPGVGTRRQRNPLIHNLLTDKPVFSSSLPSERVQQNPTTLAQQSTLVPATFIKRGMPVSIIPDPKSRPWKPPSTSNPSIRLSDPRIDLPRLIYLIEDSFNRKLDVSHYLARIENRIAGIIIAGEYEGGAILTWEPSPNNPSIMIPYLDKFAVLKRSQGAGGVADIVFKAMVRSCFPDGVCWRSRRDNPVNKWYFERARGTWKIPGSNWTMFWTTKGVQKAGEGKGVFRDYESVCRGVEPSWADNKGVVD